MVLSFFSYKPAYDILICYASLFSNPAHTRILSGYSNFKNDSNLICIARFTIREVRYDKIDSLSACIRLWPFFAAVFFIWKRVQATVLMSLELVICHVLSFSKTSYSPRKLDLLGVKIWLLYTLFKVGLSLLITKTMPDPLLLGN